ncbi:MAG: GTP-binding protein, partial [Promethearchaeota archaeon]
SLKEEINNFIEKQKYNEVMPYLERIIEVYQIAINFLKELNMESLVQIYEEQLKNQHKFNYQIKHKEWATRYNSLIREYDNNSSIENLRKLIQCLDERINLAKDFNDPNDIEYYLKIKQKYTNAVQTYEKDQEYRVFKEQYNEIIEAIEKNQYTKALKELNILIKKIEIFKEDLSQIISKNHLVFAVFNNTSELLNKSQSLKLKITNILKEQLSGTKITPISMDKFEKQVIIPKPVEIKISNLIIPLYAKVVLLGETSVGKTHLVLSMTNQEYSPTQGSTVGVDKYFLPVKIGLEGYDTQICFWDLGGQWNFSSINDLFLHDASCVLLVYDITRPETFKKLKFWYNLLITARNPGFDKIILVGNKLDVGGRAISLNEINLFLQSTGIKVNIFTSAKTLEGIKELKESIVGTIDWTSLLRNIDQEIISKIGSLLTNIMKKRKIMATSELINEILNSIKEIDPIKVKAVLQQIATQNEIQFNRLKNIVILDIDNINKKIANIITIAGNNDGILKMEEIERKLKSDKKEINLILNYLEIENIIFRIDDKSWYVPHVNQMKPEEFEIEEYIQKILDSDPIIGEIEIEGHSQFLFSRIIVAISKEIGKPEFASNTTALWKKGQGVNSTAILFNFIYSNEVGIIRWRAGGAFSKSFINEILDIIKAVLKIYKSNYSIST